MPVAVLSRHAPIIGQQGRYVGQLDVAADLSDGAALQNLAAGLPTGAVWISSQLARAQDTLAALARLVEEDPESLVEPAFAEQNFGQWQGRGYDEVHAETGDQVWNEPASLTPLGGESFDDLVSRVGAAIKAHTARHRGAHIIAVAHGGTIRGAVALALGCTPERALGISVDNLSLTRLDALGVEGGLRWRVGCVNGSAPPRSEEK